MDLLGGFLKSVRPRFDDDTIDRLNYYYTVVVLLAFAITLSAKQYAGNPVQCWVPAEFKDSWEQYTENYCYIENTYWVRMNDNLPDHHDERERKEISYYQWVPFVLAIQAFMFHIPHLLWQLLNWQSGLNVRAIVSMACDTKNVSHTEREKSVETIARHIDDSCKLQKTFGRETNPVVWVFGFGKAKGLFVTGLYVACKALYIINIIGQFFMLNSFIGSKYTFWGAEIVTDLAKGHSWENSGHFPRVTMCDFVVRALGNTRRYSVQCVLMINMFNEKIYLFLWWWMLVVAILTILNFLWWLLVSFSRPARISFVEKYIRTASSISTDVKSNFTTNYDKIRRFVRSTLRPDGVFVLRLVASNAGDVIATEIVRALWLDYLKDTDDSSIMSEDDNSSTKRLI